MGMGAGCAFDGVKKNGAHGAPHAQIILLIFHTLTHRPAVVSRLGPNRCRATPCGCEMGVQKGSNPSTTAPPAVGCAVRTKKNPPTPHFPPMFPDNKSVQPCLARQADTRRAISFDSPEVLAKYADQKETDLSSEQYE